MHGERRVGCARERCRGSGSRGPVDARPVVDRVGVVAEQLALRRHDAREHRPRGIALEVMLGARGEQVQHEAVRLGTGHLLDDAALGREVAVADLAQQIEEFAERFSRGGRRVGHRQLCLPCSEIRCRVSGCFLSGCWGGFHVADVLRARLRLARRARAGSRSPSATRTRRSPSPRSTGARTGWRARTQASASGPATLVTLALPNSIEFFAACLATWRLGATPQPVSSRLPERERRAIVELAQPALVVGAPAGEGYAFPSVPLGFEPDADTPDGALPDLVAREVRCMTSGGSTGRPKLIVDLVARALRSRGRREHDARRAARRWCRARSITPVRS